MNGRVDDFYSARRAVMIHVLWHLNNPQYLATIQITVQSRHNAAYQIGNPMTSPKNFSMFDRLSRGGGLRSVRGIVGNQSSGLNGGGLGPGAGGSPSHFGGNLARSSAACRQRSNQIARPGP
jgi:hypothetical protein